nr:polyketide synthase dehydratase domain-containing protein [Micromonospora sp. DSM 115978]
LPYVIDHCFFKQPPGWPDIADRFPVVPMTGVVEIMIDEARALAPGRVPVTVRDLRALRWLAIEPAAEVTIVSTVVGDGLVRVSVEGYARGTIVFADSYPDPPRGTDVTDDLGPGGALADEVPAPEQPPAIYEAWMFHGPGYQGMERIDALAPDGVRGELVVRSAPGALLDSVGQFFGYWATRYLPVDWSLLPARVSEFRFYGPPPVEGERLYCVVRIRGVDDTSVTADMELRDADGALRTHVVGWTDRRFAADEVIWAMNCDPGGRAIGAQTPDGWVFVRERWKDSASRDLVLRHYLATVERGELAAKNPRAARGWSLGRVAAKDAVRHWLWARGADKVWAIEVGVGNDPLGAPKVSSLPDRAEAVA